MLAFNFYVGKKLNIGKKFNIVSQLNQNEQCDKIYSSLRLKIIESTGKYLNLSLLNNRSHKAN